MNQSLFAGPISLRDPSERIAFWLTAICALPAALLIGYVLHESIGASQVALFIVNAMVYVTLARGRLLALCLGGDARSEAFELKKSAIACVRFAGSVHARQGILTALYPPKALRRI